MINPAFLGDSIARITVGSDEWLEIAAYWVGQPDQGDKGRYKSEAEKKRL